MPPTVIYGAIYYGANSDLTALVRHVIGQVPFEGEKLHLGVLGQLLADANPHWRTEHGAQKKTLKAVLNYCGVGFRNTNDINIVHIEPPDDQSRLVDAIKFLMHRRSREFAIGGDLGNLLRTEWPEFMASARTSFTQRVTDVIGDRGHVLRIQGVSGEEVRVFLGGAPAVVPETDAAAAAALHQAQSPSTCVPLPRRALSPPSRDTTTASDVRVLDRLEDLPLLRQHMQLASHVALNCGPDKEPLALVQLAFDNGATLVVDVLTEPGLLYAMRGFLEDPSVCKVVHDCRMGAVAIKSAAGIQLAGVFDLQLAYLALHPEHGHLPDLHIVLDRYAPLPSGADTDAAALLKAMMCERRKASPDMWRERPLDQLVLTHACDDVARLLEARRAMHEAGERCSSTWDEARLASECRVRSGEWSSTAT
jgi:hypothetical protein